MAYLRKIMKMTKIRRKMLAVLVVLCLCGVALATDPNLVGWWKLDSDADDYSSYGNDGTIYGNPCFVAGQVDGALSFDGSGDYVAANVSDDVAAGDLTLSMWVKSDSNTTQQFIASFNNFLMFLYIVY